MGDADEADVGEEWGSGPAALSAAAADYEGVGYGHRLQLYAITSEALSATASWHNGVVASGLETDSRDDFGLGRRFEPGSETSPWRRRERVVCGALCRFLQPDQHAIRNDHRVLLAPELSQDDCHQRIRVPMVFSEGPSSCSGISAKIRRMPNEMVPGPVRRREYLSCQAFRGLSTQVYIQIRGADAKETVQGLCPYILPSFQRDIGTEPTNGS